MKLRTLNTVFILNMLITFFFISCEQEPQYLPPKTHEGRNTVGYFRPDDEMIGGEFFQVRNQNSSNLIIANHTYSKRKGSVRYEYTLELIFSYDLSDSAYHFTTATYEDNHMNKRGLLNPNIPNFVSIDYQKPSKQIISGTFELNFAFVDSALLTDTSYTISEHSKLKIYDGRFDLKAE